MAFIMHILWSLRRIIVSRRDASTVKSTDQLKQRQTDMYAAVAVPHSAQPTQAVVKTPSRSESVRHQRTNGALIQERL